MVKAIKAIPIAALAAAIAAVIAVAPAQAAIKHYDGTVKSVDSGSSTFKIVSESGRKIKFRVNRSTEFERIAGGFDGLKRGLAVEVDAKKKQNGLLARQVEPQGNDGGDDHGGDDNSGHGGDHR